MNEIILASLLSVIEFNYRNLLQNSALVGRVNNNENITKITITINKTAQQTAINNCNIHDNF